MRKMLLVATATIGMVAALSFAVQQSFAHSTMCSFTVIVSAGTTNALPLAPGFGCAGDCPDPAYDCVEYAMPAPDPNVARALCKCGSGWPGWCKGKYTETWGSWSLACTGSCSSMGGGDCTLVVSAPYTDPEEPGLGPLEEMYCACQ